MSRFWKFWRGVAVGFSAAWMLGAGPAQAAPERADVVARFLAERGLLEGASKTPTRAADNGDPSLARQTLERASGWAGGLVSSALHFLGVPYKRGGQSAADGFDCSGFTRHVFEATLGLVLPRRSNDQAKDGGLVAVERAELQPGDLVFFNTLRAAFSHVGIYVGDGKFVHAPRSGAKVRVEEMGSSYWSPRFDGARRAPRPVEVSAVAVAAVQTSPLPAIDAGAAASAVAAASAPLPSY